MNYPLLFLIIGGLMAALGFFLCLDPEGRSVFNGVVLLIVGAMIFASSIIRLIWALLTHHSGALS